MSSLANSALAAPIPYIKPTVFEQGQGSLKLTEARHPCLEVQEGVNFISNDCHLERGNVSSLLPSLTPHSRPRSVRRRLRVLDHHRSKRRRKIRLHSTNWFNRSPRSNRFVRTLCRSRITHIRFDLVSSWSWG